MMYGHVHCPVCGAEMLRGTVCPECGTLWKVAPAAAVHLDADRRPPPSPTQTRTARPASFAAGPPRSPPTPPRGVPAARPASASLASRAGGSVPPGRPTLAGASGRTTAPTRRPFRISDLWKRHLPPVRLVWIFLVVLLVLGQGFASLAQATPILALAIIGLVTDVGFQRLRFPKIRFPDAALATTLFVAIIIWPAALDLPIVAIAVASVGLRHVLRIGGHPMLNPAAFGVTLGTVIFGMTTSWHVGLTPWDSLLVAAMGAVLVVRAPHTYRFPIGYFSAYLGLTLGYAAAFGGGSHLESLLFTGALGPASVFFGAFMVPEPRTAPSARWAMWVFALGVGVAAASLPVLFSEVPVFGPLGVLAPFLALFVGNAFAFAAASTRGGQKPAAARPTPLSRPVASNPPARSPRPAGGTPS